MKWFLTAVAALLSVGCIDEGILMPDNAPSYLQGERSSERRPQEEQFHDLELRVPGYGGHYFDDAGTLIILLTDTTHAQLSRQHAMQSVMAPRMKREQYRLRGQPRIEVRTADFRFSELAAWRDAIMEMLPWSSGAISLDLVESGNHIEIGVSRTMPEHGRRALLQRIMAIGIPGEALMIADVDTVHVGQGAVIALPDSFSLNHPQSIKAGIAVYAMDGYCTVGLVYRSINIPFFFTSSHCTKEWGKYDNDPNYVFKIGNTVLGSELSDYAAFSCGFWAKCLHADAAPIGVSYWPVMLTIARTKGIGSLVIDPTKPEWHIVGEEHTFVAEGDSVYKVGRTTGWTGGKVKRTCADFVTKILSGSLYRKLLCQDQADYHADKGDSGAPVFVILNSSTSTVEIVGMHNGRHWNPSSPFHLHPTYSPIRQIRSQYSFDPLWH